MTKQLRARGGGLFAAIVALVALAVSPAASASAGSSVAPNVVLEWNVNAEQALGRAGVFAAPHVALIDLAMVQGAVYDAVNAIDRTHQPYLGVAPGDPGDSPEAAAATAAYRMLANLLPDQQSWLQEKYAQSLATIPDGSAKAGGIAAGDRAADAMIAARRNDGRNAPFPITIGTQPGQWRPTPPDFALDPAPWVANVKPFLLPSAAALRSDGPNPLKSGQYTQDFNEVKSVGALDSTTRTPDQTDAATWWAAVPLFDIQRSFAARHALGTADTARMLAELQLAEADAVIVCHHSRYYWNFWRPITAIREAASDENPNTAPDPQWTPLVPTPPWPDNPSGHACAVSAFTGTMANFFGTDKVPFSATSPATGTTRSFSSLSQARREVVDARVWSGIHFRTADNQGAVIGSQVASYEQHNYFQPVR